MNAHRSVRTVLTACIVAALMIGAAPAVAAPDFSEQVIAGGPVSIGVAPVQAKPEMDGRYIAYEFTSGFDLGSADTDIKVYDIKEGVTYDASDRAGDNDVDDINADISMDTVVYQSVINLHVNVYLYNLSWYNWRAVTNETAAQTRPRISGRYILWHDAGQNVLKYYCIDWPQYMNQQIPATVGVYYGSWDIDGDTVVFAREQTPGDFTFYKWTLWSDATPEAFATHVGAIDVADVRLHNGKMSYTYGSELENYRSRYIRDDPSSYSLTWRHDADLFHDMTAYEITDGNNIGVIRSGHWSAALGTSTFVETDPTVFGNRIAYSRYVNAGDIVMATASESLIDRTAGGTRYETAVAVSEEYFPVGADSVVLCTGENFPDALAAGPWARFLKAPVLLTQRTVVPEAVMDEIERLGASNVWIVGGDTAVAPSVQTQLESAGLSVDRQLQGGDRYATAAKIAFFLHDAVVDDGRPFSTMAFVARGDSFADALFLTPVAAATYSPIILVKTDAPLPPASEDVFEFLPIWEAFIAGGTDVVSEDVELAIEAWTTLNAGTPRPAVRMAGETRYETSTRVLGMAASQGWLDLDTVGIATGQKFPDALGGGVALGGYGSPLLLTRPTELPDEVLAALTDHRYEIGRIDIFGGPSVVSDGVRSEIASVLP